jgi:hypothetical protein
MCFGPRLLVSFWLENAHNLGSPDLSSDRDHMCPWNHASGTRMPSFLGELTHGGDVGPTPDLAPYPTEGQRKALGFVPMVPKS